MGEVIPLRPKKPPPSKTLCMQGHHQWKACKERRFDTRAGKLLTLLRCARCGKEKTQSL